MGLFLFSYSLTQMQVTWELLELAT